MPYPRAEEHERKMLERVGILPKKNVKLKTRSFETFFDVYSAFVKASYSEETENPLLTRIRKLEETVEELKKEKELRKVSSKADFIYSRLKEVLEREHPGEIVAIDLELEQIVGIGSSILEAYRMAKKKTSKEEFSYRRVGCEYVHKL